MTGLYDNDELESIANTQTNPMAPTGLQQTGAAAYGVAAGRPGYENSSQGQAALDYGLAGTARSWYTGANNADIENGWDTDFVEQMISGQDAAAADGTLSTYFEQPGATGVVTYDHKSSDGTVDYKFGDIYQGGRKVSNIFDPAQGGFDPDTANLMMADLLFDADQKAHIYADSDRQMDPDAPIKLTGLNEAVQQKHEENNVEIPQQMKAAEFNQSISDKAESIGEGKSELAIIGGGAAGGATLAGGTAAVFSGPAAPVAVPLAALGGSAVGGLSAYLNMDALAEQAARAYEITALSMDENGKVAGLATGVNQWAGFGGKLISPLSNLTQGTYDAVVGDVGDGTSEFYATDNEGKRKAGTFIKVADVASTVGDAMLQFASPVGVSLYTAQMGGTIAGESAEMVLTGGKSFDYQSASFDNVFTDDDGHFDPVSGAAGIGKIGIDVVQLGFGRGVVGKAAAEQASVGNTIYRGTFIPKVSSVTDRLPAWMGGATNRTAAKEALAAGGSVEREGAFKYVLNAEGEAVSRSGTLSLLAPSEQLSVISAGVLARRSAAARGGAVAADDFYRAASALSKGERRLTNTIVNAMGEGYEEGIQEITDSMSHDHSLNWRSIGTAAAYGFAAGAGMSAVAQARSVSADTKMFEQAKAARYAMTNGAETISEAEWQSMPDVAKRTAAAMDSLLTETYRAAAQKIASEQANEMVGGQAAVHKRQDAAQSFLDQQNAKANPRTDGAFVISQLEDAGSVDADGNLERGSMPSDAAGTSALQLADNLDNHKRGLIEQLAKLRQNLQTFDQRTANLTPEEQASQRAALEHQIAVAELTIQWADKIAPEISDLINQMHEEGNDLAGIEADAEVLNLLLRRAFNQQVDTFQGEALTADDRMALARAVSMVFVRDPQDQAGSYQVLVPQVSARLTYAGSHNFVEVSHAILQAIRGDYDGDKIRQLAQVVLDDTEYINARSGAHYVGAGASVNIAAPKYESYIVGYMSEAMGSKTNTTLASYATGALVQIGSTIRNRYGDRVPAKRLDKALQNFYDSVEAGAPNARNVLLDGLALDLGGPINEFARENLSNEWLWIDQVVKANMNRFQEVYADNRKDLGADPNVEEVEPHRQETPDQIDVRRMSAAATAGQSMSLLLAGSSLFRQFQKLHYSKYNSSALEIYSDNDTPMQLEQMQAMYAALNKGVTQSEVDALRAKDDITGRVLTQLQHLALDAVKQTSTEGKPLTYAQAVAVVANMAVLDFEVDSKGQFTTDGRRISMTQMLLKRAVAEDRRKKDAIYLVSPELQSKHANLLAMTRPESTKKSDGRSNHLNAERAFVEVFGAQQLYTILGDAAEIFGPHLTVEQYVRMYQSMHEEDRKQRDYVLKSQPEYLSNKPRKSVKNIPYDFSEVNANEITAYRAVVDSIIAVGHNRITIDKTGELHGEHAERSDAVSQDFWSAHQQIREALQEFRGKRKNGELTVNMIARIVESKPDFARRLFNLIPTMATAAAIEERGGQTYVANWIYQMIAEKDPQHAEMIYFRNLLRSEINALGAQQVMNNTDRDEESDVIYSRLPRRMHRVIVDLKRADPTGLRLMKFQERLQNETSVASFMKYVNTEPGLRGMQAPLTAWVDDTAEFDADKAQGGWTRILQGAELREAISLLKDAAGRLHQDAVDERALLKSDRQVLMAIRSTVHEQMPGSTTAAASEADGLRAQLQKAIDLAAELRIGLGANQMMYQMIGAVRGFYPQAHTKGKNPDYVEVQGLFDAQADAIGFLTNYDQMLALLTTHSMDQVNGSMDQLAKDDVRTMDDYGHVVEWVKPSVEQMLTLLENEETRPLARAILFPQVMDRTVDNRITSQMLVGKSLKDLLDGSTMKSMFPQGDRLSEDAAFRYGSMVEALARKHGGHSEFQRAVNEIVIARTSGATRTLEDSDLERLAAEAVHQVAQVLQAAATIAAGNTDPDVDLLEPILNTIRESQRTARTSKKLGLDSVTKDELDFTLDFSITSLQDQADADTQALLQDGTLDDTTILEKTAAIQKDLAHQVAKIEALRSNQPLQVAKNMFTVTNDPENREQEAHQKQSIIDFVLTHWSMFERTPEAILELDKLTEWLGDTSNLTLPNHVNFNVLGRACLEIYVDQSISEAPVGTASPLFPDGDHENDQRYYDDSFSYLLDRLLDIKAPLLLGAKELHNMAGRQGAVPDASIYDLVARTILDNDKLGPFTKATVTASIAANERLDSAAAASALSQNGDAPKNQIAFLAATRRRYKMPTEEMLSTTTLNLADIDPDDYFAVPATYTHKGVERSTSLAVLNNRFASSVVVNFVDSNGQAQSVDLLADDHLVGRKFHANADAEASPYFEIHLDRIARALNNMDSQIGNPDGVTVDIAYFHPDTQPVEIVNGADSWSNNLFFEGTSFKLDADRHDSLNSTLWFAAGSISPEGQAKALDASKLGVPAMQPIDNPATATERKAMEDLFQTDFARMLHEKTVRILTTDLGFGKLDPEFYNAVHKDMKMRHFVRGTVEGEDVLWSAEQAINAQLNGEPLPDGATLWVPSDTVLRSMLGEQGTKGVSRDQGTELNIDPSMIRTYTGVDTDWTERFPGSTSDETLTIDQTELKDRARQSQYTSRPRQNDTEKSRFNTQRLYFDQLKGQIDTARAGARQGSEAGQFNPKTNLISAMRRMGNMLDAANIAFAWRPGGVPWVGPRKPTDYASDEAVFKEYTEILAKDEGYRNGYIFEMGGANQPSSGHLSQVSLNGKQKLEYSVAPGDFVVIDLSSFDGSPEQARADALKWISYFQGRGATIALGSTDGARDLLPAITGHILQTYDRTPGTQHGFMPKELGSRYQTPRAMVSTLLETGPLSTKSRAAVYHVVDKPVEENAGWVVEDHETKTVKRWLVGGNKRLSSVSVTMNLVPTDALAGFNFPVETLSQRSSQIDAVRRQLESLDSTEGRKIFLDQANGRLGQRERKKADKELNKALNRMYTRFKDNPGSILPGPGQEFGTGDLIPLVDLRGRVLLYRHGYKAPMVESVEGMFKDRHPISGGAANVAIYPSKLEPLATTHTGRVVEFRPRAGFGLNVELNLDLQQFGDKMQAEWNGMKYILTPKPDRIRFPGHGFFKNGWGVDIVGSMHDALSKEAFDGMVTSHRDAFAYFGVDFLPDMTEFFFPGEKDDVQRQRDTENILHEIAQNRDTIPVMAAHDLLSGGTLNQAFRELLPVLGQKGVNPDWTAALGGDSVTSQIATAMIIYLSIDGAKVEHVLRSGGFNDETNTDLTRASRHMPRLFTQFFDNAAMDSNLRTEMFHRFNQQLYNPNNDGTGYVLKPNWRFDVVNGAKSDKVSYKLEQSTVWAFVGDTPVGRLSFGPMTGEIGDIGVLPAYQRRGIATGMQDYAEANGVTLKHSEFRTDAGDALARKREGITEPAQQGGPPVSKYGFVLMDMKPRETEDQMWARKLEESKTHPGFTDPSLSIYEEVQQGIAPPPGREVVVNAADSESPRRLAYGNRRVAAAIALGHTSIPAMEKHGPGQIGNPIELSLVPAAALPTRIPLPDAADDVLINHLRYAPKGPKLGKGDGAHNMSGYLQFAELHSSGDNPIKNGMSFDEDGRQPASQHSSAIIYGALGAELPGGRAAGQARRKISGEGIIRFKSDMVDGGAWEMISRLSRDMSGAASQWQQQTPADLMRRDLAREAVIQFRKPLDQSIDSWDEAQRQEYYGLAGQIVTALGLKSKQRGIVDFWVRQALGQPAGLDQNGDPAGNVTGDGAVQEAKNMLLNVQEGYLPTLGAEVPMLHLHDLQMIYRANKDKQAGWKPRESLRTNSKAKAKSWDDWVAVSLGSALTADNLFDPMFLLALDGHMHTYQAATQELSDIPVSMDMMVSLGTLDPDVNAKAEGLNLVEKNGRFISSLDPNVNLLNRDSIILNTERATINDIIGGSRVGGKYRGEYPPASEVARRRAARRKWRKENSVPLPVNQTLYSLRKNGATYRDSTTKMNALIRCIINLRVGTATLNPALYVSMGPEQWVRGALDRAANIITMQSSVGKIGDVQARTTQRLQGTKTGAVLNALGVESVYTPEQRGKLSHLYETLGNQSSFRSMVYRDLVYLRPSEIGHGKFERFLEGYAKMGTRMQDPTYGMQAKTLARRYVDAAIQHLERNPTADILTVDQLIAELQTDPSYLQKRNPEAHIAASNAIAQLRSLKNTVMGSVLKGVYEPLSESDNLGVSLFGNLILKVPMLFSGYAMNVLTTITGMSGFDQMVAMFLDGRKKGPNSMFGRAQAAMAGRQFSPEDDANFDMSSITEGIDLSRAFIRGGLTHTGIFLMGMAAGGLGLSGEDDETKKRRRLAEAQGGEFVYDPRSLENDFRNKDAIYLNFLPGFGSNDGMVQLNWTMKQFISPILGMEKFFETGDFQHVTWGFADAVGSFPLINTLGWENAVSTAHELANQAAIEAGKPGGESAATSILANAVGTYERMLFENAFVNQLYVSLDAWDRDPYSKPLRDSDGTIQRDINNIPRENDLALMPYRDPETGEVKVGYEGRDAHDTALHVLSENRGTLAFVGMLAQMTTGQGFGGDLWRYNMPAKERTIETPTISNEEAEYLYSGAILGGALKEQVNVTPKELEDSIRQEIFKAKGYYAPDSEVMPIARARSKASGVAMLHEGSILDPDTYEGQTEEAFMIYNSLWKGSVKLGDPSLAGLHVTFEQRTDIQLKWREALVQEGINLGLDRSKAEDRMERLWQGPYDDPSIEGIGDLLWKKPEQGGLSYADSVTYRQRNTTYVPGPDGFPWATGFDRGGVLVALGLSPIKRPLTADGDSMGTDNRLNSTDLVNQTNTGLRGLVLTDKSEDVPTDKEIGDALAKAIADEKKNTYTPFPPYKTKGGGGSGYGGYHGYGGYGGGGGGYSGPRVYFQDMRDFADIRTPYANNIPFINTSNPVIRRGDVRRERVWSERGRLKQWQ